MLNHGSLAILSLLVIAFHKQYREGGSLISNVGLNILEKKLAIK